MKNPLLILLISLSCSLNAQTLPTQIKSYEWDPSLFDWVLGGSVSYQYDERDSVRVTDSQSNWFGPSRQIISKDEKGRVIKALYFWMADNIWLPRTRTTTLESTDEQMTQLVESWDENEWKPLSLNQISTRVLAEGIETDRISQSNDSTGNWVNSTRYISRRNGDGLEVLQIHYDWDQTWVETYHWENQYNEQGDLVYSEYGSDHTQEISRARWTYIYNDSGQPLSIKRESSFDEPVNWILLSDESLTYDEQGRLIVKEKITHTQNRLRRDETEYRGDTIISSVYQATINQPLQGQNRRWTVPNITGIGYDLYWRNDSWENNRWVATSIIRRDISYDQYDNITRLEQESLENGEWKPAFYHNYTWEYTSQGDPTKMVIVEYNYNTQLQRPFQKQIWRYEDRKKRSTRPLIEISPNPSTGPLTVNFHSAPALPIRWEILDETGRLVRFGAISEDEQNLGMELMIEGLQFGLYIIQIQYEDGSTVAKKWQKI